MNVTQSYPPPLFYSICILILLWIYLPTLFTYIDIALFCISRKYIIYLNWNRNCLIKYDKFEKKNSFTHNQENWSSKVISRPFFILIEAFQPWRIGQSHFRIKNIGYRSRLGANHNKSQRIIFFRIFFSPKEIKLDFFQVKIIKKHSTDIIWMRRPRSKDSSS